MKYIVMFVLLFVPMAANDIDNILMDMEVNNDLSTKTKKENNGIVKVYTRSDLNMMNAMHLRDVLKSSVVGFKISRYGLMDPNTLGISPFSSSNIRIYIDNQEISSTLYGSGMVTGDMNLDFVDHIEIYTYNPSFEFSTEPATIMIKLYTKTYERDPGTTLRAGYGSYGSNVFSATTTNQIGDYKYMIHVSKDVDNKEKSNFGGVHDVSRDTTKTHGLISLYNDKRKFLLSVVENKKDSFLSADWTGDPSQAHIDINMFHVGYEEKFSDNILFELTYDTLKDQSVFANDNILFMYHNYNTNQNGLPEWLPMESFDVDDESTVTTAKLQKKSYFGKHQLLYGLKYRWKDLDYTQLKTKFSFLNTVNNLEYAGVKKQNVYTYFLEDNYSLYDNSILTLAMQHSSIDNNNDHLIEDDCVTLVRFGNTYLYDKFIFQSFLYYQETAIEPFLINSIYLDHDGIKKQKIKSFIEKIKYTNEKNIYDFTFTHEQIEDYFRANDLGFILNASDDVTRNTLLLRWTYNYANVNKFFFSYYLDRINSKDNSLDLTYQKVVFQNANRYDHFNLFEELIVSKTQDDVYYDLSVGMNYQYNNHLNIQLNVENLLNRAEEQRFIRNDVNNGAGDISNLSLDPILLSPIDRKIMLTLEYTF